MASHVGRGLLYRFFVASQVVDILKKEGCWHLHTHFAHVPTDIAVYASGISDVPFSFTSHANDLFERGWFLREKVALGSQIHTPQLYEAAASVTLKFLAKIKEAFGLQINSFDLGGGFGVPTVRVYERADQWLQRFLQSPYASPEGTGIPSIEAFAEAIARAIRSGCRRHKLEIPTLVFEPGRIVSSSAQVLLARVIEIKSQKAGPDIAVLDTGINIASPVRWEYHEILAATKITAEHDRLYRLAGPISTPGDLLSPCKRLPPLHTGDVMAIMDAGAYFSSFENNFSFPKPSIVVVRRGSHSLIRTRETFEDLVQRDRRNNEDKIKQR